MENIMASKSLSYKSQSPIISPRPDKSNMSSMRSKSAKSSKSKESNMVIKMPKEIKELSRDNSSDGISHIDTIHIEHGD